MNVRTLLTVIWIPLATLGVGACGTSADDSGGSSHQNPGEGGSAASGSGSGSGSGAGSAASAGAGGDGSGASGAGGGGSSGSPIEIPGWTLTFNDEFEGTTLDPSKGWQVYAGPQGNAPDFSHFDPAQVSVSDGMLRLKIERRDVNGRPYACGGAEPALSTVQTYGRWVARVRFPPGKGNVGYIGLFGETETEIDFGEVAGKSPLMNSFTQHWGNGEQEQYTWTGTDSTADFHEYTVIWEPGKLSWIVDGVELYQATQHFDDAPLLFAMGDWAAPCDIDWAGCPDETTPYPAYMDVDYVRIYQKE